MAERTLRDLIDFALSDADQAIKTASSAGAPAGGDFDFLEAELEGTQQHAAPPAAAPAETSPKLASLKDVVEDADYAEKLAQALTIGAVEVAKLASGGPAVSASGRMGETTAHPKPAPTAAKEVHGVANGQMANTAHDFTSQSDTSGAAKNHPAKTAADARVIEGKMAQAQVLRSLGQKTAADALEAEAKKLAAGNGMDGPAPTGGGSPSPKASDLVVAPGTGSHFPDNKGVANLTKGQARDRNTRDISQYFSQPPHKDPAVAANNISDVGLKLSADERAQAVEAYINKLAAVAQDANSSVQDREKASSILRSLKSATTNPQEALLS